MVTILVEVEGDSDSHAAGLNATRTMCDKPASFPLGGKVEPTCFACREAMGLATTMDRLKNRLKR
ncbi:hypothetical protein ACWGA9_06190 [Streptomyces sp. NPDC054950]